MADYHLTYDTVPPSGAITIRAIRFRVIEVETLDTNIASEMYEKYVDTAALVERVEADIMRKHLTVAQKNTMHEWTAPPKTELTLTLGSNEGPYKSFQGFLGKLPADLISGEFSRPGPFTIMLYPDSWAAPP